VQARLLLVSGDIGRLQQQLTDLLLMDALSIHLPPIFEKFYLLATEAIDEGYAQLYQVLLPTAETWLNAPHRATKNKLLISAAIAFLLLLGSKLFFHRWYTHSMIEASVACQLGADFGQRRHERARSAWILAMSSGWWATASMNGDGFNSLLVARLEGKERLSVHR